MTSAVKCDYGVAHVVINLGVVLYLISVNGVIYVMHAVLRIESNM